MFAEQRMLASVLILLCLACMEIQACLPVILPVVGAVFGGFGAGRFVGSRKVTERPETKNKGCFADSVNARAMGKATLHNEKMTKILCHDECKKANTKFLGLQNGTECYCANTYDKYGQISSLKCNKKCPGNDKETCGGYMANNVFIV